MKRLGPHVRLEANVLRYLPRDGMPGVPPLPLHPLLALVLARFDRGQTNEQVTDSLTERLATSRDSIEEIVSDARM